MNKHIIMLTIFMCCAQTLYSNQENTVSVLKKKPVPTKKKNKKDTIIAYGESLEQLINTLRNEMKTTLKYEEQIFNELSVIVHQDDSTDIDNLSTADIEACSEKIQEQIKETKERIKQIQAYLIP